MVDQQTSVVCVEAISSCAPTDPVHDEADDAALSHRIWCRAVLERAKRASWGSSQMLLRTSWHIQIDEMCVRTINVQELVRSWKWTSTLLAAAQFKSLKGLPGIWPPLFFCFFSFSSSCFPFVLRSSLMYLHRCVLSRPFASASSPFLQTGRVKFGWVLRGSSKISDMFPRPAGAFMCHHRLY